MAIRKKLGDLLIESGAVDELQLKAALSHQRQWGGRLGRILVEMRFVQEQQICDAVAKQLHVPSVRLLGRSVDARLLELVPLELCEKHWVFPLALVTGERGGDRLQIAMSDPTNLALVDELQFRTGKHIEVAVAPDSQIDAAIRRHFYGETLADQRPRSTGPLAEVQFGGQEVDLSEPTAATPSSGAARPAAAVAPVPFGRPHPAVPALGDPLGDLYGGPASDDLDALLGIGDPAVAGAASVAGGSEGIDSARRALFAAPGGHAVPEESTPVPPFVAPVPVPIVPPFAAPAAGWASPSRPPAEPPVIERASPAPAARPPASAPAGLPPGWPSAFGPGSIPASPPAVGGAPGAPGVATEEPAWGEPELLEEIELGFDEAPLVMGTLIDSPASPEGTPASFGPSADAPAGLPAELSGEFPGAGPSAEVPLEDDLELDPGVSDPLDPADPLDPLADAAGLVAALESMAAGHEDPLPPGRLVAALALALIRKGTLRADELLAALK